MIHHNSMQGEKCVHQMFEAQVEERPEAIAVTLTDAQLSNSTVVMTYRELDRRANQLAHYLHKIGVGQETWSGFAWSVRRK